MHTVTFDFHDTLVHCDEWFRLEVEKLPSAFLAWHERHRATTVPTSVGPELERAYRRLRSSIIQHGHELSAERSLALVFDRAGIPVTDGDIAAGVEALMRIALDDATAVPGAVSTVNELADAGVSLGVVSSAVHHPFLEWALERFQILDRFATIVTSAEAGYYKSRPEIYWTALDRMGARPGTSVHVGDSGRFDVDGAARAGMRTVWLRKPDGKPPTTRPHLTIETLSGSVPAILDVLRATDV